ncbi:PAS domain-containing sensor histidine kinase [Solibacillus daqui]|uniref:sensor histidine kinase n=1 Tax=Solibacillus daqui TaxID=2912187 RepID=UPI002366D660|nr:PAS domain-containing sensor histidine kinase [Solibacillus daqui]
MTSRSPIDYLKDIYEHIQDGIIIMKTNRKIMMMNPAAKKLTGWKIGDTVPFCTFCMERQKEEGEPTCYLIANSEVPSFLSQMPTYHGMKIDVEMSTAAIYSNDETGETEYLLVLRDQETFKKAQEVETTKKMIRALIEAKESEHKRLAQELHDGVGQSLFTVSVALQAVDSFIKDNDKLNQYIKEVQQELQKAMDDVNAYSHQLRPHSLDQLGLEPTIRMMIENIMKNLPSISIELSTKGLDRCDPVVEINLYRVIQEALHNVVKYANANKVQIRIVKDKTHIYMNIRDNGNGFNRENIQSEGLGLKHMEERIDLLNGKFDIDSTIGNGTSIDVVVPSWRSEHD